MKKIFSIFAAVLFAGSMMAQSQKVTLDFTSGGVAGKGLNAWGLPIASLKNTAGTYTNGTYSIGISASTDGHKAMYDLKKENEVPTGDTTWTGILYGKSGTALTLPAMTFNVGKIIVYYVSASGSANTKHNIYVGDDAVSKEMVGCKITAEADSSVFNIAADKQTAGTVYALKVNSSHNMQVSKIEFYEAVAGAPEKPAFSVAAGVYGAAQSVELSCATEGAEIYYTIDGTNPTSASSLYSSAIAISETTTIKAIAIKAGVASDIASATYEIVTLVGDGSAANPFTCEDVAKLKNTLNDKKYWVKGYILGSAANDGKIAATAAASNICLGDSASQVENCIPVELPSGDIRNELNIVDFDSYLHTWVRVYGNLVSYFNFFGVKGTSEYSFAPASSTAIDQTIITDKAIKLIENGQIVIIKNGVRYNALGIRL